MVTYMQESWLGKEEIVTLLLLTGTLRWSGDWELVDSNIPMGVYGALAPCSYYYYNDDDDDDAIMGN